MSKRKVPIIIGPTSSGKTSLAIKLCQNFEWDILSADSRQVYKKLDIGTGKLPVGKHHKIERGNEKWIVDGVNIFGYDLINWGDYFSAHEYATYGLNVLNKSHNIIVVGGTGFYIDVLTGNVKVGSGGRDEGLRQELEKLRLEELQEKINKNKFNESDFNNKFRLIRSIEKDQSFKIGEALNYQVDVEYVYVGLTGSRDVLYSRVDAWVDKIWGALLVETVELELKTGLVYKTAAAQDKEQTKFDLHAYIRRQQTYFKKMDKTLQIEWFDISEGDLYGKVADFLA